MQVRIASVDTLEKLALAGADGAGWYDYAHGQVRAGAALLGVAPRRLADLLAVFSPRVTVKRSIRLAVTYARTGEVPYGVLQPTRLALDVYERTGRIRGPKTEPFARALTGDADAVTLDVWMAKAFGVDQSLFSAKGIHDRCRRRVESTARRLGWTPAEVQAAVWTATVRRSGRKVNSLAFTIVNRTLYGDELAG